MILYFNNKEYPCKPIKVISPKLRGMAADILKEYEKWDSALILRRKMIDIVSNVMNQDVDMTEIDIKDKFAELIREKKIPEKELNEILELATDNEKTDPEKVKEIDKLNIQLFKVIMECPKGLEEQYELDSDSDFWQSQDCIEMEKEIDSFCRKTKLRKSEN
jgi:hypothetical protein